MNLLRIGYIPLRSRSSRRGLLWPWVESSARIFWCSLLCAGPFGGASAVRAQDPEEARDRLWLEIGGRLHSQIVHSSSAEGSPWEALFRRARIGLEAGFGGRLRAKLEHDFANGLQDAYLKLSIHPALGVTAGQFKRSFDLFELQSTHLISVVERDGNIPGLTACDGPGGICSYSRFSEALQYSARDIGLRIDGILGNVSYQASVTSGSGATRSDENDERSFSGRAAVALRSDLRLGGNFSVHDYPVDNGTRYGSAFGADLELGDFLESGPHVLVGIMTGDNWAAGDAATFLTGQVIYMHFFPLAERSWIVQGFEPLARISWGDPDRRRANDHGLLLTPGLMVYFTPRFRVGAGLDVWEPRSGDRACSFRAQAYLRF